MADLTNLEQNIMRDYGQYISVPLNVYPRLRKDETALNNSMSALQKLLPAGVNVANNQLQIATNSDLYKKYAPMLQDPNAKVFNRNILADIRNSILPANTKAPFSFNRLFKAPQGINGINAGALSLLGQVPQPAKQYWGFGMYQNAPQSNSIFDRFGGNTQSLSTLDRFGNNQQSSYVNPLLNAAPVMQTRSLDDAIQQYRTKNNIPLEKFLAQLDEQRRTREQLAAAPKTIEDINQTMYAQPVQPQYAHGGQVKTHYADGDLVDIPAEYDAANPDFASQVRANMEANPLYAGEPQVVQASVAAPSASERAAQERRAILNSLQTALAAAPTSSKGMSEQERNFRLAAAFAKPTRFGSFGESLGNAAESLADIESIKRAEQKDIAAQELARLQSKMGLAQQQYELSREEEMRGMLKNYLAKGRRTLDEAASGATGASEMGVPDDVAQLILAQPTDKAIGTLIDIAKENNKPSDLIRGVNFLVKSGSLTREEGDGIIKQNLTPKFEMMDVNVPELGGTVQMSSADARKYNETGVLPARLTGKAPATAATAPAKPVKTKEQLAVEETALKEQAKKDIEQGDVLLSQKSFADQQIQAAKEISALAKKNPKAFGLIADPTLGNAIATIIDKGVSTPWGNVGVSIEEPLAKMKLTGPEAQARQAALRPITMIEVGYRKMFLKGEGAVSNMEGELVKYIGPQMSDKPQVIQMKAGMVQIGAEKQKSIVDAFEKYKEKNPAAGPRSFYQTPTYKNIVNTYENKYSDFAKANGIDIAAPAASKGGSSLVDRLKQERSRRSGG